ncbi:MAG: ABC transporter permease [Candidatus Acidiferrum sp.]
MPVLAKARSFLRNLFLSQRVEVDLDKEVHSHLELLIAENIRAGMPPAEAQRAARIELGGIEQVKEQVREERMGNWLRSVISDCRYGIRQLLKYPGFTVVATLTLALGVGANTTIFSMVNALVLRPLPVPDPQQIVVLAFQQGNGGVGHQFSVPEYRDIASQTSDAFSGVFGYWFGIDGLSINGRADRILTNYVTGSFFSTLRIKPLMGRFVVPGEGETPNADAVIVLSYEYWRARFDSDPSIVGRKVLVDGKPVTVIGVTPKEFCGISTPLNIQAYLPLGMLTLEGNAPDFMQNRTLRSMSVGARLLPGRTVAQSGAALAMVAHRMAQQYPAAEKDTRLMAFPELRARPDPDPNNTMLLISGLFLGLVAMILLLACLNVANILVVRATTREGEMAIRAALGAGRTRLIRQLLTESILLALVGAAAGLVLGRWATYMISSLDLHTDLLLRLDFPIDWRVFAYTLGAALLTGMIVGVVPAFRASRTDVNTLLHQTGRGMLSGKRRLRSSLVVAQVAGSLVLLIMAGLFVRSLKIAQRSDLGFDPHHVVDISMDPGEIGYNEAQGLAFYETLLDRARSLPGVEHAGLTSSIPLSYYGDADSLTIEGYHPDAGQRQPRAMFSVITPEYLDTLRIPLVSGRSFTEADSANSPYVAIINQTMALHYWPNQDPLGGHFSMGRDPKHSIEVVGVAKNSRVTGVTGDIVPNFYVPLQQHYASGLTSLQTLVVRVNGNPAATVPELEAVVRSLAPDLPAFDAQPMLRAIDTLNGLLIFQFGAVLVGTLGGLGLVLSIVGVYGVLSYSVSQRRREIGIRIALGAPPASILTKVLREGALLVGIGLAIGIACALAASKVVESFLTVSPSDPITYISVTAVLTAAALAACYLPARRATKVDPIVALRYE